MTPPTRRPLERAAEHLAAGRFAEAAGAFRATLQIDPTECQAMLGLAECALGRDQRDAAFDYLVLAAQACREKSQNEDALAIFGHAVEVDPDRLDVHVDIAELEAELGQIDQARARLEGLSVAYENAGRYEEAAAILDFVGQWDDVPRASEVAPEPIGNVTIMPDIGVPIAFEASDHTMICPTMLIAPFGHALPMVVPQPQKASEPEVHVETVRAPAPLAEDVVAAPVVEVQSSRVTEVPLVVRKPVVVAKPPVVVAKPPVVVAPPPVVEVAPPPVVEVAPTPSSRDAKGRSLTERLRQHREATKAVMAAAKTARPPAPAAAPATTPARTTTAAPANAPAPAKTAAPAKAPPRTAPAATKTRSAPPAKPAAPAKPTPAVRASTGPRPVVGPRPAPRPAARPSAPPSPPARTAPTSTRPSAHAKPTAARPPTMKPAANERPPTVGATTESAVTSPRARVPKRATPPGTPQPTGPTHTKPLVIPKPGTQEFDDQRTVLYRRDEPSIHP